MEILQSHEITDFKKNYFQKKPYLFTNVNSNTLVNWSQLNRLIEKDILHYPRIRLANDRIPEMRGYSGFIRYSMSPTGDKTPHINRHQLYKCLNDGATLILDRCQSFFDGVDKAKEWISNELDCSSSANLYAAFSDIPSFGLHFDNHDVLAIQIEGVKRWEVHKPTRTYPLIDERSFGFSQPSGEPDYTFNLQPGQALYLPAGYWHNVSTQTKRSLHITFTIIRPRRLDLINAFIDEIKNHDYLREPIPFGESLSNNNQVAEILNNALSSFDINMMETLLKMRDRRKQYIKIDLENINS